MNVQRNKNIFNLRSYYYYTISPKYMQYLKIKYNPIKTQILNRKSREYLDLIHYNQALFTHIINRKHPSFMIKRIFRKKFKLILFLMVTLLPFGYFKLYKKENINSFIDKKIKKHTVELVCHNKTIQQKISFEILNLVKNDEIKLLLRQLILDVLRNKEIEKELAGLIRKSILDYITSERCEKEMKHLVFKEVLKNPQVNIETMNLIEDLTLKKEMKTLEKLLEDILVDVLNIEVIHSHVAKRIFFIYNYIEIESELNNILRDKKMVEFVISKVSEYFQNK